MYSLNLLSSPVSEVNTLGQLGPSKLFKGKLNVEFGFNELFIVSQWKSPHVGLVQKIKVF